MEIFGILGWDCKSGKIYWVLSYNVRRTFIEDLKWERWSVLKRKNSKEWKGPDKVMLIEGKMIIVNNGNVTVKVNKVTIKNLYNIQSDKSGY